MQINHNNIVKTIKIRWVYAQINTKIITRLQSFGIQLMPPCWGSQQVLSAPPQPTWGTDNILIQGHANILRWVDTMT